MWKFLRGKLPQPSRLGQRDDANRGLVAEQWNSLMSMPEQIASTRPLRLGTAFIVGSALGAG